MCTIAKQAYYLLLCCVLTLITAQQAAAQKDTIRIFQYNLLNYGSSSNPVSYKDSRLTTIINQAQPDIFGANEIASGAGNSQNILINVLGSQWTKGSYVNTNNEIQTNMLFWRKDKFALKEQKTISHNLRDIIAFTLYYKDTALYITHDTVFLTIIVAHLKAGSTTQDEADRAAETQTVVNYLNGLPKKGNYFFMGDMNVYSSTEACYAQLINNTNVQGKLYDPVNKPGAWNANSNFTNLHTQSTRTTSLPDGGVTGGLDDRFDQILVSDYIMKDSAHVKYLPNSYKVLGQDGNHFNKAINAAPTNNAAPAAVIQALYEMSDHLPVYADFVISPAMPPVNDILSLSVNDEVKIVNPFHEQIIIQFPENRAGAVTCTLYNTDGKQLFRQPVQSAGKTVIMNTPGFMAQGLYLLEITDEQGVSKRYKLIKE